jgi:hypothetical protein
MAVLPDHVAEHQRIAEILLAEGTRLSEVVSIDPQPQPGAAYHVVEHNRLLDAFASFNDD